MFISQIFLALHNIEEQVKENSTIPNFDNGSLSANDTYLIQTLGPNTVLSQPYELNLTDATIKMPNTSYNFSNLQQSEHSASLHDSTTFFYNTVRNLTRHLNLTFLRQMNQTTTESPVTKNRNISQSTRGATKKIRKAYFVTAPPSYHMYYPIGKPH